ncbi:glycosyltransferase family 2 protein [Hymenobacter sp. BT188]|uniref:glycosyltransferase family 2 protein n=1 Tax=Hymenobacter sp. BT188 TaxID=2763504 RepID=UPI0021C77BBE|nr:glycosyltransferase [Hymenobacter sp. BT188]
MIPTYNCSEYLKETLAGVLAQAPGPDLMQIEVIDDASTDEDVGALVANIGAGRVQYFRQPINVGSIRNFETCINRSRGHLIHLLHGNDRVKPGFYEKIAQLFQQHPEAGAAFSHCAYIDEQGYQQFLPPLVAPAAGILPNWLLRIAEYQRLQYVSSVVRREVYEKLGSFYGTNYGEDWEMWVRIAAHYPVAYLPEVLAEYRGHPNSISEEKAQAALIVPDLLQVMKRIQQHVPVSHRHQVLAKSKKYYARMSIGSAHHLLKESRSWRLAHLHIKQALALSRHPAVYGDLLKFYFKSLFVCIKRRDSLKAFAAILFAWLMR